MYLRRDSELFGQLDDNVFTEHTVEDDRVNSFVFRPNFLM